MQVPCNFSCFGKFSQSTSMEKTLKLNYNETFYVSHLFYAAIQKVYNDSTAVIKWTKFSLLPRRKLGHKNCSLETVGRECRRNVNYIVEL